MSDPDNPEPDKLEPDKLEPDKLEPDNPESDNPESDNPESDNPESKAEPEPERINLFTVSAMRLHLPRGGMPPTPGTEPSMAQRLARRVRQAGALLDAVRERLRGR